MKQPTDWPKTIAGICGGSFFLGILVEVIGTIAGSRDIIGFGALMMMPLFLGIVFALAALGAEKAEEGAESVFGKGLLSKSVFWIVLGLIVIVFLFTGYDGGGQHFRGSID